MYGSSLLATATCLALAGSSLAFKPFIPEARTESLVIPRQNSRFGVRGLNGHHDDLYNITLFHINDVHAHLDEFRTSGADCTDQTKGCVGGYARVKAQLAQLRPGKKHSLFLNLGDEFQGTLFFTFYGGEKIATTINDMGFDAFIPGNHEFDRGDDYLAEFLKNLTIPVLSANIKTNHTGLKRAMVPYKIFKEHDLAIFGLTTPDTAVTSKPGPGTSFLDPVTIAQATVDEIKKKHRISRIVAMTHIGYSQDMALAANTTGIDIILGGHSHSLLGDMAGAVGKYPTIIKNKDGEDVPVVTSYRWGEYLGYMDLSFNKAGKIVAWTGAPIHLVNTTTPDTAMFNEIKEWRQPFDAYGNQVIGHSDSLLDQTICQSVECNIGDFIADATLAYRRNVSEGVDLCILNAGGIRASIDAGDITIAQVLTTLPFGNLVSDFKLAGSAIWTAIEGVVSKVNQINGNTVTSFIQVSKEVKFTYNPTAAVGSRLVSLEIAGEAVTKETTKEYSIVTWDFVATGGDNIFPVQTSFTTLAAQDQAVIQYLQSVPSVNVNTDGRIATVS